jgi:hypothetical protein
MNRPGPTRTDLRKGKASFAALAPVSACFTLTGVFFFNLQIGRLLQRLNDPAGLFFGTSGLP